MGIEIHQWLEELGLGKYESVFAENEIGLPALPHITEDDLKEMGVALGARRQMLAAIAELAEASKNSPAMQEINVADASRRQVTALFADISGFTRLSNTMDAEEIHAMLNGFFASVDEVVRRYGGTVDKHIGDAVMAVFGAPVAHTDDPERALRAALDIHQAVDRLVPPIKVHIGVAAGQVVASTTGSAEHAEYTVTGDSVNLAARLTDMASAGQTFTSASVKQAVGDRFIGEDRGLQLIVGMPEPMTVYELTGIAAGRLDQSAFVGREREITTFEATVDHCLESGDGATLIVRGEAGIGKTRLLEEFEQLATGRGFTTHTGLVLDFGTARGQDAVGALVRSFLDIAPNSDKQIRVAAAEWVFSKAWLDEGRWSFLYDLLDLEMPADRRDLYDAMDNATRNRGKKETLIELATAASKTTPLLLKIEDLHWADQIQLEHAAGLARQTAGHPIILLLTTRLAGDPLNDTWLEKCPETCPERLDLGPMAASEATDLAQAFGELEPGMIREFIAQAGGNPLFLEQLLHNAGQSVSGELPGTVQGIVQARLDALAASDRRALQAASILGQRFSLAALGTLMENDNYRPDELLRQALVRRAGEDFHFAHALIRDSVYASLLKPQRIALHGRAAAFYEETDLTLHAKHLDQAANSSAPDAYMAAAQQQSDDFHYDGALQLINRALELDCSRQTRFEATCFQGDLRRDLAQTAASVESFERSLETAESDEQICRANLGLADALRIVGRQEDALTCLDHCQVLADKNSFHGKLSELHYLRGSIYHRLDRLDEMSTEHETSLKYAQTSGTLESEARALGGLGDTNYSQGRMQTANSYFARCVEIGETHGLMRLVGLFKPMLAWSEMFLLRLDQAIETAGSACSIAAQTGEARTESVAHGVLCEIYFLRGQYSDMRVHGDFSLELARRIGARRFELNGIRHRGLHQFFHDGELDKALETLRGAYQMAMTTTPSFMGPWALGDMAIITETLEERGWALGEGERLLHLGAYSHNHFGFRSLAIDACLGQEDWDGALAQAAALEKYCAPEPVAWSDFFVRRGRALAIIGLNQHDDEMIAELRDLKKTAETSGLNRSLPAIDAALAAL